MGNTLSSGPFASTSSEILFGRPVNPISNEINLNNKNIQLFPQGIHIEDLPFCCNGVKFNDTEGIPTDVSFTLDSETLSFSLNYNGINISGEIHSDGSSKSAPQSVNLLISVNRINSGIEITSITNTLNPVIFKFLITDFNDLNTIQFVQLRDPVRANAPTTCDVVNSSLKKIFDENNSNLKVELFAETDNFGLNLGELGGIVTADESYPNGYPKELVGTCDNAQHVTNIGVQTLYSFKPKLRNVLKGTGNTLFAQTNNINSMYNTGLTDCEFYLNILAYSTFRYMLAGLSSDGNFTSKWLNSNNYTKFLRNLRNSEFAASIVIFTEPQPCFDFTNFNQYFIECNHKKPKN